MKKLFITSAILVMSILAIAQKQYIPPTYSSNDRSNGGKDFNKDNIFLGGSLALGFGSYSFNVGGTPEIGYTFNDWFDAGISFNLNYQSVRADPYYNNNVRQRSFNYGGGPFFRVYPLKQFFIQGQFEENWVKYNFADMNQGGASSSLTTQASSFLAGIGYTQRIVGQGSFYTLIMMDLMTDPYSPYRLMNSNNSSYAVPVIRAGFNFYLHSKKR
ncbi:hypothetical protein GALL_54600 [mine drainage metagenome]|uniref:Outer membrane protein beta-barrel domain-containing protein n=1 Tax=mine drainage metagenome TaxID=410659 RepID=A0A1J5TH86_9ZZZZ